jgi:miniconductance mechanosensitive channel
MVWFMSGFYEEWKRIIADVTGGLWLKVVITIVVAACVYFLLKYGLAVLVQKVVRKTKSHWDDVFCNQKFFERLAALIPPMASYVILSFIHWEHKYLLLRVVDIWLVLVVLLIITSLLTVVNEIYESYPISKNRPITFFIQLIKVFL